MEPPQDRHHLGPAFALPFLLDIAAAFFVWFVVWPFAIKVTEKLVVLGFIFVVLTAISIQVRNVAHQVVIGLFLTRRPRTKHTREA